jgi:hypothetical protein
MAKNGFIRDLSGPNDIWRGRRLPARAAAQGIVVRDEEGNEVLAAEVLFRGASISEDPDDSNIAIANVGGGGADSSTPGSGIVQMLNNSGADLALYDVVVVDETADNAVTTTTTAQDTRKVGVVQADIADGEIGPVLFSGWTPGVHTEAAVTRGDYLETSTTAGAATTNPTRREGSFGVLTTGGDPAATTSSDWRVWRESWSGGALGGTPAGWEDVGFDDSAWFAPHDVSVTTISHRISPEEAFDSTTNDTLIWLARSPEFELTALPSSPVLKVNHDDTVDVYVNGVLVHNGIGATSDTVSLSGSDFVIGTNVVAVRVVNSNVSPLYGTNPTFVELNVTDDNGVLVEIGTPFLVLTGIPSALLFGDDLSGPGGTGTARPPYSYVVAPSDAPAALQAVADAVCDGTADEVELNAAISSIVSGAVSASLLVLPGTYSVAAGWDLTPLADVAGRVLVDARGSILEAAADMTDMVSLAQTAGHELFQATILLGAIDGKKATRTVGAGVHLRRTNDSVIEVGIIHDVSGYGFKADQAGVSDIGCFNNRITIDAIRSCSTFGFYGVGGTNVFGFEGNVIRVGQVWDNGNGFVMGANTDENIRFNTIIASPIEHNGYGIYDRGGGNTWIVNNLNANSTAGIGCPAGMARRSTFIVYMDGDTAEAAVIAQHYVLDKGAMIGLVELAEQSSVPGTPASGFGRIYFKSSDSKPYAKNDAGTEYDLTATGGAPSGAAGGDLGSTYPNPTVTGLSHVTAGGDLTGTMNAPTVAKINGSPLGTISAPATADRLRWNGSAWVNSSLIWAPVMVLDPGSGNYLVLTDISGNPIMAEV